MCASRREKRTSLWLILSILLIVGVPGALILIFGKKNDPYRTIEKLNAETYLSNGTVLRGNVYKIEGTVHASLAYGEDKSRLFAIQIGNEVPPLLLPIIIPASLADINLEKGQRVVMKVQIGENGFIQALESQTH